MKLSGTIVFKDGLEWQFTAEYDKDCGSPNRICWLSEDGPLQEFWQQLEPHCTGTFSQSMLDVAHLHPVRGCRIGQPPNTPLASRLSPFFEAEHKRAAKEVLTAFLAGFERFPPVERVDVEQIDKRGDIKKILWPVPRQGDTIAEITTPAGEIVRYKLKVAGKGAWWELLDRPHESHDYIFEKLGLDGDAHCLRWYDIPRTGQYWPEISIEKYPDNWRERIRGPVLGFAEYGCKVVITCPNGAVFTADARPKQDAVGQGKSEALAAALGVDEQQPFIETTTMEDLAAPQLEEPSERAEIRLPDGTKLTYELVVEGVGFWWCDDDVNSAVFDKLGIDPEAYCANYYTPRGGEWPAIYVHEPKWRKRLIDAMVGLTDHGCAVTIFDRDGIRVHHQAAVPTPTKSTWTAEEKATIEKYLESLIEQL